MTALDSKFSTFADGGDLVIDDIVVGLRNGVNTRFSYQGGVGVYLPLAGGTMSGSIDMDTNGITNLVDPTNPQDAATKNYVDTEIATVDPLTTKGDLYTYTTVNARLAVGTVDGQILQVNAAAASGLAWSTASYPATAGTSGNILTSNGTNWASSSPAGVGSPLTTKGDIYAYSTTNARFPVAVGDGKILQVSAAAAFGIDYSTATYPTTTTVNELLYSSSADVVAGLTTANSAMLSTTSAGVPAWSASMLDGEMMIGATGSTPAPGSLIAGTGISIAYAAGDITIATTGSGLSWNSIAGTSQAAAVDSGYYCANAGATTVTLPATCALGQVVLLEGTASGGAAWILTANVGQTIQIGASATSSGGTLTAAAATDNIEVVCIVANTTWRVQRTNSSGLTIA